MNFTKKTYRIEDTLAADICQIAAERKQSENQVIEDALRLFRDYHYSQNKACFINEQFVNIFQSGLRMLENTLNQRSNQLISELAIQSAIQNQILADNIEVGQKDLHKYRLNALDSLKQKQRIFRMSELEDE